MECDELNRAAEHMLASYSETADYSRQFRDDHGTPPTMMAKVHHHRSLLQAHLTTDDLFELSASYAEYGRVHFTATETGSEFVLRSRGTLTVERATNPDQLTLFPYSDDAAASDVELLVYEFAPLGMTLWTVAAARIDGKSRLVGVGDPVLLGVWPYVTPNDEPPGFDQDRSDPFDDLGDLDDGSGEAL